MSKQEEEEEVYECPNCRQSVPISQIDVHDQKCNTDQVTSFSMALQNALSLLENYQEQVPKDLVLELLNSLKQSHDTELTSVTIADLEAHEREIEIEKRKNQTMADEFSVQKLIIEEKQQKELAEMKIKLTQTDDLVLPEERDAMQKRKITRIRIERSDNFTGKTSKEYHFRLAESQFLRMCSTEATSYRVDAVEYIVNPELVRRSISSK